MLAVNITADPIANRASDQHIGEKVITAGKARNADDGCYSISAEADRAIILVFMRDYGCQCPGDGRMSGWKRGAAVQLSNRLLFQEPSRNQVGFTMSSRYPLGTQLPCIGERGTD